MLKWLHKVVSGLDNDTPDFMRLLGIGGGMTAFCLQIYVVVWKGQSFDMQSFGIGCGALFASVGAAIGMKAKTEPESKP